MKKLSYIFLLLTSLSMVGCTSYSSSINKEDATQLLTNLKVNSITKGEWINESSGEVYLFNNDSTFDWYSDRNNHSNNVQQGKYTIIPLIGSTGDQVGHSILLDINKIKTEGSTINTSIKTELAIVKQSSKEMTIKNMATGNTSYLKKNR